MCADTEKPTTDESQSPLGRAAAKVANWSPSRRRKETLLPQITQLALDGHSGETIARKLGIPKRTVNHWLQRLRQKWTAKAEEGAARMMGIALARLESVYREAMEEWRGSQGEIEVRLVEDTEAADGGSKKKRSVRTLPPRRNAALLARATVAAVASCRLMGRPAPPSTEVADRDAARIPLETLTEDDLQGMTFEDLRVINARLSAKIVAEGGTVPAGPTDDEMDHMSYEELRDFQTRCEAEIAALDAAADSPPAAGSLPPQPLPKHCG